MLKKILIFTIITIVAIQFIPLDRTNPKIDETLALHTDKKVMKILKTSCYDCHSYETKYSDYAYIAPFSFGVISHIKNAREALNFSKWKKIPNDIKKLRLKRAIQTIRINTMPLPSYAMFHSETKLSKDEKIILTKWFEKELKKISTEVK